MKTSELTGKALDWAVAVADNRNFKFSLGGSLEVRARTEAGDELPTDALDLWMYWNPSTNWAQGGPIVEREFIAIFNVETRPFEGQWAADVNRHQQETCDESGCPMYSFYLGSLQYGPTPLIAAMRCFVASKLGDEIEQPAEL